MKKSFLDIKETFIPALIVGCIGAVVGPFVDRGHPFATTAAAIFFMGFTATVGITIYEKSIKKTFKKKHPFFISFIISTVVDTIFISISEMTFVHFFGLSEGNSTLFEMIFRKDFLQGVVIFFILVMIMQLFMLINTLIGQGVLIRVLLGHYHKPVETEMFFMFVDMKASTSIAEKLGHLKFLSLLNDFFYEVSGAVKETCGEIYKYVGDEAIIVWSPPKGMKKANCLRCYFEIEANIKGKTGYFMETYGIIPEFKAGVHYGKVIAGEIGEYRKEIAYIGDTVNTTARIEKACATFGKSLIISEQALSTMKIPNNICIKELGSTLLRGKEEEIMLYSAEKI